MLTFLIDYLIHLKREKTNLNLIWNKLTWILANGFQVGNHLNKRKNSRIQKMNASIILFGSKPHPWRMVREQDF